MSKCSTHAEPDCAECIMGIHCILLDYNVIPSTEIRERHVTEEV